MSNRKKGLLALAMAVLAVLFGFGVVYFNDLGVMCFICAELLMLSVGLFLGFLIYFLVGLKGKKPELYKIIALALGVEWIGLAVFGAYDIMCGDGFLPGLLGGLIHIFVLPVILLAIILVVIIGSVLKKKKNKQ